MQVRKLEPLSQIVGIDVSLSLSEDDPTAVMVSMESVEEEEIVADARSREHAEGDSLSANRE